MDRSKSLPDGPCYDPTIPANFTITFYSLAPVRTIWMTEVTNRSAFQKRSLGKQVLFTVLTLGFYPLYWWHLTHTQLSEGTDADFDPTMRTIGLLIPFYNFLVLWKTSNEAAAVTDKDGTMLFAMFLLLGPIGWYMVQSGFNTVAQ